MFRLLRKNMKKILVVTILLIVPPFVIWGVGNMQADQGSRVVGRVYGKKITLTQYLQARDACMLNLYLLYGPNFRELLPMLDLNRQTWDRLLLLAKARKEGIVISDAEVAAQIEKLFRRGDAFDKNRYEAFLEQSGLPVLAFEQRIRDTLAIGRLTRQVTDTALITQDELEEAHLARGEKVRASYVTFRTADYLTAVGDNEAAEREYFRQHEQDFRVPERVKARYILLSPDEYKKGIKIGTKEIRDLYDANPAAWAGESGKTLPLEKVQERIRQELLRQKATDTAFERATDISMSLFDQPDLAKAAKAAKLELRTTDLFWLDDAKLPLESYEFAQTAFATEVGNNSGVIKTAKGFAILSPIEKQPAHVPPWEQVKNLVRDRYKAELARTKMMEQAQKVKEQLSVALAQGRGSLAELLKPLGLKLVSPAAFTRDSDLGNVPNAASFKAACFQTPVGGWTSVIPTGDGALLGIVEKREPGNMENFDKEKETLRLQLLAKRKDNIVGTWYMLLRKEARLEERPKVLRELGIR